MLAAPIVAPGPFPPFAASVKDGYAVIAADGPGDYPVVANVTAGHVGDLALRSGQVAYITTGAPMPAGSDAVIQVEDVEVLPSRKGVDRIRVIKAVAAGKDVRAIGADIAADEVVLPAGSRLGPAETGIAVSVGANRVLVHRKPRVAIFSTGDELAKRSGPLPPGAIRDSNGPMLVEAVRLAGGEPVALGVAPDDPSAIRAALADGLSRCEVVVTTGGVSMGEMDHVRSLAEEMGQIHFGRLLLKPGKPCTFATVAAPEKDRAPRLLFALPGNPVSSLVTFYLLVLPAIRRMAGWREPTLPRVQVTLREPLRCDPQRPDYQRTVATWDDSLHGGAGGYVVSSTGIQTSSRLMSLRGANALVELPQREGSLERGSVASALLIV